MILQLSFSAELTKQSITSNYVELDHYQDLSKVIQVVMTCDTEVS